MMKTALITAALATLAGAAPAFAKNVAVSYKDLDLATSEGKATLAQRLDSAAREACGVSAMKTGSRLPSREAQKCYKQAQQHSKASMATILEQARLGG